MVFGVFSCQMTYLHSLSQRGSRLCWNSTKTLYSAECVIFHVLYYMRPAFMPCGRERQTYFVIIHIQIQCSTKVRFSLRFAAKRKVSRETKVVAPLRSISSKTSNHLKVSCVDHITLTLLLALRKGLPKLTIFFSS